MYFFKESKVAVFFSSSILITKHRPYTNWRKNLKAERELPIKGIKLEKKFYKAYYCYTISTVKYLYIKENKTENHACIVS